jgi:hypothetical protein
LAAPQVLAEKSRGGDGGGDTSQITGQILVEYWSKMWVAPQVLAELLRAGGGSGGAPGRAGPGPDLLSMRLGKREWAELLAR